MTSFDELPWHDAAFMDLSVTGAGEVSITVSPIRRGREVMRVTFIRARSIQVDCDLLAMARVGYAVTSAGSAAESPSRDRRQSELDARFGAIQSSPVQQERLTEYTVTFVEPGGTVTILAAAFDVS
jgi:hypothetical protein